MKKILSTIAVLALFTNAFAVDLSIAQDQNQSQKIDKSNSMNKTLNNSEATSKDKSHSRTSDTSNSEARSYTRLEQTDSLTALLALEMSGIEPFASCSILSEPKFASDFGLTCEQNGMYNSAKCSTLDLAAKNNRKVVELIGKKRTEKMLEYADCSALYGGLIAQQLKTGKFSVSLNDKEIKNKFMKFSDNLDIDSCKFYNNYQSVSCSSSSIIIDKEPTIELANIKLYSKDNYYGYSANKNISNSSRYSDSKSLSESKKRSEANDLSKSITMNQSMSQDVSSKASSNLSLGKFIPGE